MKLSMRFLFIFFACFMVGTTKAGNKCKIALLVIDVQNCFVGGSLAVKNGNEVIPVINEIRRQQNGQFYDMVVHSQDWHPPRHVSFYSTHKGTLDYSCKPICVNQTESQPSTYCRPAKIFQPFTLQTCAEQMLWPDHCVQNTHGAQFAPGLIVKKSDIIIRKGKQQDIDSYSVFFDNDGVSKTELDQILKGDNITTVVIVGLAFDYCVGFSALDARKLGFEVFVVENATKGVSQGSIRERKNEMIEAGVQIIDSEELEQFEQRDLCQVTTQNAQSLFQRLYSWLMGLQKDHQQTEF